MSSGYETISRTSVILISYNVHTVGIINFFRLFAYLHFIILYFYGLASMTSSTQLRFEEELQLNKTHQTPSSSDFLAWQVSFLVVV